jgi:nitrite reductase/ring-hydroxylating ferredoxin subunit/uncharacterized membrane protein
MRSKAHFKSHPIHPILICFPIAFFTATLFFDLAGYFSQSQFWRIGRYMEIAGIVSALVAAIPGIIDYIFTVPPASSAKNRATRHATFNVIMLILFATALIVRKDEPALGVVVIELVALIFMSIAGWHGGTLVHRNQIGVDTRYAHAGKWREKYYGQAGGLLEVATTDELKCNQMKLLHVNKKRIVLARTESGYVAFSDHCTHRGGSLAGGSMACGIVQCPWHGSQFNVATGEVKAGPASEKIAVYKVAEQNGKIFLKL